MREYHADPGEVRMMVFEQLFTNSFMKQKSHAFSLAFIYSIIGILSAGIVFPSQVGPMSVAFISLLLVPSLARLLASEENIESREKKMSVRRLFNDHRDIFKVYFFIFMGVFLCFILIPLTLPSYALETGFSAQLSSGGIVGSAFHNAEGFIGNNLTVLLVCFILSLAYGAGAILFLSWNASVWGVTVAFLIKESMTMTSEPFFSVFINSFLAFLPHLSLEAIAYISAAIAGGVISKAVIREKMFSKRFHHVMTDGLLFLIIGVILVFAAGIIEFSVG